MLGVQDQAIEYLLNSRAESLIKPDHIFDQMTAVGLTDNMTADILSVNQKREAILSAALNHDIFNYLSRVISDLSTGEHAASGCTLRFNLEWAWKHTAIIKDPIDSFCVPIFDCSVVRLDTMSRELLSRKITQLNNLNLVFKKLKQAEVSSELSVLELDVKHNVIHLIQDYLKILRWFIEARLLPEQLDDHLSFELNSYEEFHFIYKQKELRAIYEERRKEIKEINRSSESSLLIIDGLIDEAGKNLLAQWRKTEENSSAKYPPPSLYALLSMYYLESMDESLKHTIITYFLLDILAVDENNNEETKRSELFEATYLEHRQTVSYFPQTFQIPPSQTKLIKAFWLLDHRQFQESCWTFCEPGTERVTQPWQHRRILQAYMTQAHADLALQYLVAHQPATSSLDDVKLHIDVLVKNKKLQHALNVAQMKGDPRHREAIYSHLFSTCYKHDNLPHLLDLTVSRDEEKLVSKYLESSNIPHAHDILVLHLLRRSRYVEALKLYKKNKKLNILTKQDELEKGYHSTLNHIVQGYLNFLPQPLKDFAHTPSDSLQRSSVIRKDVPLVRPLSSMLNSTHKSAPLSQASLLSLSIAKSNQGIAPPTMTPFRQKPKSIEHNQTLNDSIRYFSSDLQTTESKRRSHSLSTSVLMKRTSFGGGSESPSLLHHKQMISPVSTIPLDGLEKKRSFLMKSASILLQTPPIQRSRRKSQNNSVTMDVHTPHSILKVRQFGEKTPLTSTNQLQLSPDHPHNFSPGSNLSLKDDVAGRLVFNDQGLDSSGSDCETPAWIASSMTSQRKKTPKSTTLLNSTFNIETPPVSRKSGTCSKGKVGFSDTPRTTDSVSSTKRLRFRDLVVEQSLEDGLALNRMN